MFSRFLPSFPSFPVEKPRRRHSAQLWLERLEDRCTPSVTSTLHDHVLTITGDNGDNHITITELATPGSYTVAATDGLVGISNPTGVTSIVVDTKGGTDTVCFVGNATSGTVLQKSLSVTGAGSLTVNVKSDFNVAGDVKITDTSSSGLTVTTVGPDTSFGNTTITGGSGGTTIDMKSTTINGDAKFDLGSGTNSVTLGNTNGDPADGVTVKKSLTIHGGAGDDSVSVENNTFIGGNVDVSLDGGSNTFAMNGTGGEFPSDGVTVAGKLSVESTGALNATIKATVVKKDVDIDTEHSADATTLLIQSTVIFGNLDIDTGSGDDTIGIQATVNGNTEIDTDGGNDTITIADSIFKKEVDIDTGTGDDMLIVEPTVSDLKNADRIQTQFFGKVHVDMGSGNDQVILGQEGGDDILFFAKDNMFDGGTGTNTIATTNAKFNGGPPIIHNFV